MSYVNIKFADGTEKKEYYWSEGGFRVKDGMLIISKGRYEPSLYINMQMIRSFKECDL